MKLEDSVEIEMEGIQDKNSNELMGLLVDSTNSAAEGISLSQF